MAMKHISMMRSHYPALSKFGNLAFRWEWAIEFDSKLQGKRVIGVTRFKSREEARIYKRQYESYGATNVKIKRRLVQVNWEDYSDSFKWNRGCGK